MKATETYYENKIAKLEAIVEEVRIFGEHLVFMGTEGIASSDELEVKAGWFPYQVIGKDILYILSETNATL